MEIPPPFNWKVELKTQNRFSTSREVLGHALHYMQKESDFFVDPHIDAKEYEFRGQVLHVETI